MDGEGSVFAAIYARTSPNNRSNYSIDEQINQCWEYCEKRGWTVRYVFVDQDQSGGTVERARFQHMLEKAEAEEFAVIVFWKLDRFCRSLVDLVNIERTLRQRGVQLCSVTEFIDTTTSVGRFNYRNLASVAELERELIGERARLGLYALAREGRWPNPHPPFGYIKDNDGRLIINEDEAEVVRRIFKVYVAEKSMPQVAFELNKEHIPARKGRLWNAQAVREVLTNPIYAGRYSVAGVENKIERCQIVTEQALVKANETMLRYRTGKAERPPMPQERRIEKIATLHGQYQEFVQTFELPASP
jgi:site-specific DNA recombinase